MKLSTEVRYEAVVYLLGNCLCGIGSIACGCSEVDIQKEDTVLAFCDYGYPGFACVPVVSCLDKGGRCRERCGDNTSNPLKRRVGTLEQPYFRIK